MKTVRDSRGSAVVWGFVLVLLLAPVCLGSHSGHLSPFEEHVKANDPKLFQLYSETHASERQTLHQDRSTPLITVRQQVDELRTKPRSSADAAYIVNALVTAYNAEPRDWATVGAALTCAQHGVNDPRVIVVAEDIVRSVPDIPDDKLLAAVPEAMRVLALTHRPQYISLLTASLTREALGLGPPGQPVPNERQWLAGAVVTALYHCLSLEEAKAAFQSLAVRFPLPQQKPEATCFEYEVPLMIDTFLNHHIPRVERGEGPEGTP